MTIESAATLASPERLAELRELRALMDAVVRAVADGAADLSATLELPSSSDPLSEAAANLYVVAVVEAVPGIGKVAARRLLAELGIAETTRLGELTAAERAAVLSSAGRT